MLGRLAWQQAAAGRVTIRKKRDVKGHEPAGVARVLLGVARVLLGVARRCQGPGARRCR